MSLDFPKRSARKILERIIPLRFPANYVGGIVPNPDTSELDNSTYASSFVSLFYHGATRLEILNVLIVPIRFAQGIIPLAIRASFHSLSASVINNFRLKPHNTIAGVYRQGILLALPVPHEHNRS